MILGRRMSVAARLAKSRSKEIDLRLKEDCKNAKEVKVLLLGSDESECSTVFKAIRMIHQNGLTPQELETYRPIIVKDLVESAQTLVEYINVAGIQCEKESHRLRAQEIMDFNSVSNLPSFIAQAIHEVWNDSVINAMLDGHSSTFRIPERSKYFLDNVLRIGTPDYLPTETDALRARERTTGIVELTIPAQTLPTRIFTVGSHSPRQKWLQCFESISRIVFCTSVGDYIDIIEGGEIVNRLQESLVLFRSILCSPWFARSEITLLFTNVDLLSKNLPKFPLDDAFPEYNGGEDLEKAKEFILSKFLKENRREVNVHSCFIQRMDADCLRAAVPDLTRQIA